MKKHLCVLTFILLLFALTVNAEPVDIILKSPSDGASASTYKVDFIYSFSGYADILNCSLIINDEVKGFRNTLFEINDNKISLQLESGSYEWFIRCFDSDFNEMVSETRSLSVNVGGVVEGYETVYNYNGLRSYVITLFKGQNPIELPAMKGGEDIQIKIGSKKHYLDVLKMGADVNTSFVEVRDRASGDIHRMLEPSTLTFDFDEDKTVDIQLHLKEIERNVNAYFVVTPYPGYPGIVVEEEPEPEPTEETQQEQQEPVEEPTVEEETPEEGGIEEPEQEEKIEEEPEPKEKSSLWLVLIIIVVVLAIILVIVFSLKGKKGRGKGSKKKVKIKPEEVKSEKIKKEKKEKESESFEDWPVFKEKHDIITSQRKKKK